MQSADKLEAIRKAAILANPEIVELKFGCVVDFYKTNGTDHSAGRRAVIQNDDLRGLLLYTYGMPHFIDPRNVERVIGRPIRLADIFLAIKEKRDAEGLPRIEEFLEKGRGYGWDYLYAWLIVNYDLTKDDITLQSPEFIDFAYSLLKPSV